MTRLKLQLNVFGDTIKTTIRQILGWLTTLCRIVVGVVVIKTGFDYASGTGSFAYQETDGITGIFAIIVGTYFILSSIFPRFFDHSE